MNRRWWMVPGAAAFATGLAGCASSSEARPVVNAQLVPVEVNDMMRFVPDVLHAHPGRIAIQIRNVGALPHDLDIPSLHEESPTVPGGHTANMYIQVNQPGTYAFDCDIHLMDGMVGTLVVTAESAGSAQ